MVAAVSTAVYVVVVFFYLLCLSSDGPRLAVSSISVHSGRRILHQPFFPQDNPPPSSPPPPSPPPPSSDLPFFPTTSTPPPSQQQQPPASPYASFPANISSLIVPHSSSSKSVSKKLVAVTVVLSLSAAAFAAVALYFYFRGRRNGAAGFDDKTTTTRSEATTNSVYRFNVPPPPPPPLRKPTNNSSEFLYIGTLVNSGAIDAAGGGGGGGAAASAAEQRPRRSAGAQRKMRSPELNPLPPIMGRQLPQNHQQHHHEDDEDQEEFYSPRGSASGRESGSGSRRVFEAVVRAQQAQSEQLMDDNNGGRGNAHSDDDSTSSSSSSSPARSASISISPPVSNSSRKDQSNPKSSPEFIEMTPQPMPEMMSPTYYPSSSASSSPERGMKTIKEEDEAEESPLLSNASGSSRITSPIHSPRLSPLTGKIGQVNLQEERDWGVLGRSSPTLSTASTPARKSSSSPIPSFRLPAFLGGKKKVSSSNPNSGASTMVSNSPVSPHSPSSPISSTASSSRHSRSYPASPLSNASRMSSGSDHSSPRLSNSSSRNSSRFSDTSDRKTASPVRISAGAQPPAPPPPPPLPLWRRSQSPPPPPPPPSVVTPATPLKPLAVEKLESPAEYSGNTEIASELSEERPKLKPLHWDKVRASSDREMVWDQLRSSSFKLNEEMIETLFVVKNPAPIQKETPHKPAQPSPRQENRVLDPKKAQNIAILLRALNVTMEEVCEALLEGNAETLGTELLESLLKMAPTKEEERRLQEYNDDSPVKLGHAEKFLKAVIDVPFAFKRMEAMLYVTNFDSEIEYLKKSFDTLEAACDELRSSRMFLKLLEAVLKTGNRMNVGTNRGDAHAFKLDTLLKLVDIKGADGKTTLLHFVVQEIIRTEGQRLYSTTAATSSQTTNDEVKFRKLGLQVVSALSSELASVKKAAAMDSDSLTKDVGKLSTGLANILEVSTLVRTQTEETSTKFSESMHKFMKMAEEEIFRVQAQERVAFSLVKEITEYFHGNSAKEEAHPLRIFMVVRDFLEILDRVCKEVGLVNERTVVSSAHRFPVPVNPLLPVPVNPQVFPGFLGRRGSSSSEDGAL